VQTIVTPDAQAPRHIHQTKFLRMPEVLNFRARSRSSLYRDVAVGLFPPPISIGPRCSAWVESEVELILRAQVAGASPDEIRQLVARVVTARAQIMPIAAERSL
jgi:prophage regulatory protein